MNGDRQNLRLFIRQPQCNAFSKAKSSAPSHLEAKKRLRTHLPLIDAGTWKAGNPRGLFFLFEIKTRESGLFLVSVHSRPLDH